MKKALSFALAIILALSLCACGQSANQKAFKSSVKAIPKEITYEAGEQIAEAFTAYQALSDEEKLNTDTSAYDSAVVSFSELPAVEVCADIKSRMKDPSSFRLYGDVVWIYFSDSDFYTACIECDAKNGFGAYSGVTGYESYWSESDGFWGIVSDDNDSFVGIYKTIMDGVTIDTETLWAEKGISYIIIPGKAVAAALGCEYIA